ncbi:amidoligase family protein [Ruminococcus sp. MSJ-25]|uniref:amidoligase family protein n=1 Tax=Ruminococcus sp. MSJ-25 TaxID=2841536 RepID=UPI001C11240F|nr:amidoligase family protein [Ruminococcus sp. MSJ-25]MBU5407297.1 amidoligase family protein [Ruminococcus sp. MSJ-25]
MSSNFDGIKTRKYGIEIEMTGLTRSQAAKAMANVLDGRVEHEGGYYDKYIVTDSKNRKWAIVYDGSINCYNSNGDRASTSYSVEMNSPVLEYEDIPLLQVSSARESYCHKMNKQFIEDINRKKPKDMEEIKRLWYRGRMSEQFQHYSNSRYVICNLHSFFQHGHYEIRAYNGSLHAGEVRSQIVLALAISNAAMTKKYCSPHVSQSDNMRYSFRVWLLNLGLIGEEFKNCRTHLLKHLEGDIAWRHPEDGIAARAKLKEKRELERQAAREQRVELVSDNSTQVENVPEEHIEPSESECDEFEEEFEMSM